jgi:hypothetical protein
MASAAIAPNFRFRFRIIFDLQSICDAGCAGNLLISARLAPCLVMFISARLAPCLVMFILAWHKPGHVVAMS